MELSYIKGCGKIMGVVVLYENNAPYQVIDYDGLWKKIIHDLFEEFILFFAPELHSLIDFNRTPNFLQQELYKEIIDNKKGKNIADLIVKVPLKSGTEKWVFIHIEVQGAQEESFSKRMFQYFYRIYDRFDEEVYAIALLTSDRKSNKPDYFHYAFHGTTVNYTYNTYKFHEQSISELEKSTNPFAAAVIAGKYANKYRNDFNKNFVFKRKLMRQILKKFNLHQDKTRRYISSLFYFIDYLLQTQNELNNKLKGDLFTNIRKDVEYSMQIEKRLKSRALAGIFELCEQEGRAEGKKLGIEEGRREGRKEGKKEGIEEARITFAKALINEGFSNEKIVKLTKLEHVKVAAIRNSILK